MRLRTKLFIAWSALILLLWAGTLWPVQRAIESNFAHVADGAFAGTRRGLDALQAERLKRMRQAGRLVMSIPELRALIAEDSFEISTDNLASLAERLDGLAETVGVDFVCAIDGHGALVAQNRLSPWPTLGALHAFASASPQAAALVRGVLAGAAGSGRGHDAFGLWVLDGNLYQVVGVPLIFGEPGENPGAVDGAILLASRITDELATELGAGHNCEVTFLAGRTPVASSLMPALRELLEAQGASEAWKVGAPFETRLGDGAYRSWLEPLNDEPSGTTVGAVLVQSGMAESAAAQARVSRVLLVILVTGLLAAALCSYLLSGAVTRPVAGLVRGVKRVAAGDLDHSIRADRADELGELASAFNDMVAQLRSRRELQRLVEESQAASRAKSQFLANMSHEIRTPLNGVVGMADLLLATRLDDRQRRFAGLVKSSAEVLTTLINDVLDFSKIEAGKLEIESIEFDPGAVVEDVVEILAPRALAKGLEVVCDVGPDVPARVVGDPNRLRQVLINLLGNAVKFTTEGQIIVGARRQADPGGPATLRFWVTDTGIGIPLERRDRLFKSFSQVDASTTRRFGGTGLGLAISKQLAELMGGAIGVESRPGCGSTFWFTVAAACEVGRAATERPAIPPRALLIEAHASARDFLSRRLVERGFEVVARDPAVDLVERAVLDGRFVLVLAGVRSLGPTGADTRRALRAIPGLESARTLAITRLNEDPGDGALLAAGFDGRVVLPVRRAQLWDAVRAGTRRGEGSDPEHRACPVEQATLAARRGVRVLLADDHEVNRLVVAETLANAGYSCVAVEDGVRATEAATGAERFDIVLMDCQMPRMDGFEATRRIRAAHGSGPPARRTWIVALTANAVGGDRERCLEAGMDDYCPKPIDGPRLIATLDRLAGIRAPEGAVTAPAGAAVVPDGAEENRVESPDPLDYDALLRRCSGKPDLAGRVLDRLIVQATEALDRIEKCVGAQDAQGLASVAHGLKGTAGMASADPLRELAAHLEALGRSGDLGPAEEGLRALKHEVQRCDEFIRRGACAPGAEEAPHAE